jgi:hypothetical protein
MPVMLSRWIVCLGLVVTLLGGPARGQSCLSWVSDFPTGDVFGSINTFTIFDDGSGPAVYAGGAFALYGGGPPVNIAKWTPGGWMALGEGLNGAVNALAAFTDAQGPALYAGGDFTGSVDGIVGPHLIRWSGTDWEGRGAVGGSVRSLCVHDDGAGPALFVGGDFVLADGVLANRIARLSPNGAWSPLGTGCNGPVLAIASHNAGSGTFLYAGGAFTTAGGGACDHLARWSGAAWTPVGGGLTAGSGADIVVRVLRSYNDGAGPALYVGGSFGIPRPFGEPALLDIAKWDGAWQAVGPALQALSGFGLGVTSIEFLPSPQGLRIYAGGDLYEPPSHPAPIVDIMEFDGASWHNMAGGMQSSGIVRALLVADLGAEPRLVVGGDFMHAGPLLLQGVASWGGGFWAPLGAGITGTVRALLHDPPGLPPGVYVGGEFENTGSAISPSVARWDGQWHALGQGLSGPNHRVFTLCAWNDGSGPALYAGGVFSTSGPSAVQNIARWNGTAWLPVGTGINGAVLEMAPYDDGRARVLLVAGNFTMAGGSAAVKLAKWDGTAWWPVADSFNGTVSALTTFGDATGLYVYIAGTFSTIGGVSAPGLVRWSPVSGFHAVPAPPFRVYAMCVANVSGVPQLFAGGADASLSEGFLGTWDGATWGVVSAPDPVEELAPLSSPPQARLAVGGSRVVSGNRVNSVAIWDGVQFQGPAVIDNGIIDALHQHPAGGVLVGGSFMRAGSVSAGGLATLPICAACYANCDGSQGEPVLTVLDFNCFLNRFAEGNLQANCDGSQTPPVLNVLDFNCFLNRFAAGCP